MRKPKAHLHCSLTSPAGDLKLVTATAADLAAVEFYQKQYKHRIGFLSHSAHQSALDSAGIWMLDVNGQRAGYLLSSGGKTKPLLLRQIAVDRELWNNGIGKVAMKVWLQFAALTTGHTTATARTREDVLNQIHNNLTLGAARTARDAKPNYRGQYTHTYTWRSIQKHALTLPAELHPGDVPTLIIAEKTQRSPRTQPTIPA